jgi:hypothetical protein
MENVIVLFFFSPDGRENPELFSKDLEGEQDNAPNKKIN